MSKAKSALAYCVQKRKEIQHSDLDTSGEIGTHWRCSCWCCCKNPPDVEFYEEKVTQLTKEFTQEKVISLQKPVGTIFISFKTCQMATEVHDQFKGFKKPKLPKSAMDLSLRTKYWKVKFAPEVEDVYWESLGNRTGAKGYYFYKAKYILVNIALLLFLLFLSTPCKYLYSASSSVFY